MPRAVIEHLIWQMNNAYTDDPFHALRRNLASVTAAEWGVRPAGWTVEEFGNQPELDICDMALHVGGAKYMYTDRLFGPAALAWGDIKIPATRDMDAVLAWLDEGQRGLVAGLAALTDDAQLKEQRPAPWNTPMRREQLIGIVMNHDLYHSGEINRQRGLIRGSQGWDRR